MTAIFELLYRAGGGRTVVVRDDQASFEDDRASARLARSRGGRFSLVDTGKFETAELEWLCEAGADLFTSDGARPDVSGLRLIGKACVRGDSLAALLIDGPLGNGPSDPAFAAFRELLGDGFSLHVSNRERPRDFARLTELVSGAGKGRGSLVYYHHGAPAPELEALADAGARIHLSDKKLEDGDGDLLRGIAERSRGCGPNLFLYVEKGLSFPILRDLWEAGAVLLFKTPPSDAGSSMRKLENAAREQALPPGTYYLDTTFLL
jgi:hypothetical protein